MAFGNRLFRRRCNSRKALECSAIVLATIVRTTKTLKAVIVEILLLSDFESNLSINENFVFVHPYSF